ncbi:MAG: hypothetical protein IBJ03_02540 [Gemmatimonadaceae bacterium]|nr:hypothetical protein [Gemmatimonadaceae bacterium]
MRLVRVLRLTRRVCGLLVVASSALPAQAPQQQWSVPQMQEDLDVLRRAMEEAHGGLHRWLTPADLDKRWNAHRAGLTTPLTTTAFAARVSEYVAEVRDGHLRLEYDSLTNAALVSARVLPLRVALEDERLIVRFNDSPTDTTIRPGMEIVRINGRSSQALVKQLLPTISGDGFIVTGRRARLAQNFAPLHWLFVEPTDRYRVVVRRDGGAEQETMLEGIEESRRRSIVNPANATLQTALSRLEAPPGLVSLDFPGGSGTARLRIRAFDGQAFPATLDSAFRVIRERGVTHLVLDMRGNGGGIDQYGALLVSYLVSKPFNYFDYIHLTSIAPSFATWLPRTFESTRNATVPHAGGGFRVTKASHSGVGEQQPAAQPYTGTLHVLIDGGSFSTTADVAAQLRSQGRAVFIGEETAGTYEGNTSNLNAMIVLPNSRLRLKIMMYGYWNAVKPQPGGRGTIPEHTVPTRVADQLQGRDRAIELAQQIRDK